jgi:hypothetical protein
MVGAHTVRGGRYKCDFCDHTSYKTQAGILNHLSDNHLQELLIAEKDAEIERLKNKPPKVVEKIVTKERVVYKDKPEPKYWYTKTVGIAGIYCSTCKQVTLNPGIPTGQTIENTPHHCGNRTLMPVVEVR